jgi:hypothetical protein
MKAIHRLNLMLIASAALGAAAVTGLKAQAKPPVYVLIDISEISDAAAYSKAVAALPPNNLAPWEGAKSFAPQNLSPLTGQRLRTVSLSSSSTTQPRSKPGRICLQPSKLARFV